MAEMKHTQSFLLKNRKGLHARPASTIVRYIKDLPANIIFRSGKEKANAKHMLELLTLSVSNNSIITVEIYGKKQIADMIFSFLDGLFNDNFGE